MRRHRRNSRQMNRHTVLTKRRKNNIDECLHFENYDSIKFNEIQKSYES